MIVHPKTEKDKSTSPETTQATGTNGTAPCAVCDRLTPEESARRFNIFGGINAIPVKDMPGRLKPLAHRIMDYCGFGQCTCYATHDTLGSETGCSARYVRDLMPELLDLGWFVCTGRRGGTSKHAKPEFTVGPRMVAYLRSYFAAIDARKAKGRRATKVDVQSVNLPTPNGTTEVDVQTVNQVDVQCVNQVDVQSVNNPMGSSRLNNGNDSPSSNSPPQGGSGGGGGSERLETLPRRRGGGRKKPASPSTQSHWRDLSVIPPEQWTDAENNVHESAWVFSQSEGLEGFEGELLSRWTEAMDAAQGRLDVMRGVIEEMMRADVRGKKFPSPFGYFLTVIKQRSRPASKTVAAMMDREKPEQKKPGQKYVVVPPEFAATEPSRVRSKANEIMTELKKQGMDWPDILAEIQQRTRTESQQLGLEEHLCLHRLHQVELEWAERQKREEKALIDKAAKEAFAATFFKPDSLPDYLRKAVQA